MIIGIILILIIIVVAYFLVGNYFYNFALNAKRKKEFLQDNPNLRGSEAIDGELEEKEKALDRLFKEEHIPTVLTINSNDNLKLHGNLYENNNSDNKWAIIIHGFTGKSDYMTRWIRNFYQKGYNIIAPDLRGHGKSEGHYIGMGWDDRLDIILWIDEIIKINSNAKIILFGISMGAATVMCTSGENLPPNVKVIVEDCGYSSTSDIFAYQLKDLFKMPRFPIINAANTVTKIKAGYNLFEATPINQVVKNKIPTIFIHGDKDTFVPYEMLDKLYNASKVEKEKLVIEKAGHGEAVTVNPELYWNTIWSFVRRFIED